MHSTAPVAALLFDFDGTLWDCEPLVFQAYDEYFQQHGHRMSVAAWSRMIGTLSLSPWRYLEELTGGPVDHRAADEAVERRKTALLATGMARAGVHRFVAEADAMGLRRAIVSNSHRDWIARYSAQCGIHEGWELIESADGDSGRAKPAPFLYFSAVARLGVHPDRIVAFEDSLVGVRAAKLAGVRCVAVAGTLTGDVDFGEADARIEQFDQWEPRALLEQLGASAAITNQR